MSIQEISCFTFIDATKIFFRETTVRLNKAEEECGRLQQELTSARRRSASLDADFHTKERTVHQLRTKLAVVEQVGSFSEYNCFPLILY